MTIEHFQNLVIGCGVAGKIIAWTLAKQDQKTAVVERSMIGGSCVNVPCCERRSSFIRPWPKDWMACLQAVPRHPRREKLLSKEWREQSAQGRRRAATSKGVTQNTC